MILKQLAEARYVGSEPIDEFYGLYDLDKKRFVKENKRSPRKIFQRTLGIRTAELFDTKDAAESNLQSLKNRAERAMSRHVDFEDGDPEQARRYNDVRNQLEAVRVVKITASMSVQ
jgi:hypothetical protein